MRYSWLGYQYAHSVSMVPIDCIAYSTPIIINTISPFNKGLDSKDNKCRSLDDRRYEQNTMSPKTYSKASCFCSLCVC